ncbi:hypothetical protein BBI10_18020 [Pseudomonas graminis]|uniref:Uncharacterized protein n=1 Tax=Pseudomonas graminis TaxID=158627 RepID=A0A1C2DRL7_9PSED|nr:hypothetical protein BBI10_18020 [Pseudomonas graminis]
MIAAVSFRVCLELFPAVVTAKKIAVTVVMLDECTRGRNRHTADWITSAGLRERSCMVVLRLRVVAGSSVH